MFDDTRPYGALDRPDPRDYWASHILGVEEIELPDKVKMWTKADDQDNSVKCTCYSSYHVAQILNEIEHRKEIDGLPDKGWELQKKLGTYSSKGDYVQTALNSIVKNGFHSTDKIFKIEGYARIQANDVKYWLAQGYPVVTSAPVTKTNFKKAKYEGTWSGLDGDRVTGHAFALIGYEDDYVWALNSYGDNWGYFHDGTFKILLKDLTQLGSCYIIYDTKDVEYIFRDVTTESPFAKEIKWGLENELMKGYDSENLPPEDRFFKPENPLTRAEFIAVLNRFYNKYFNQ